MTATPPGTGAVKGKTPSDAEAGMAPPAPPTIRIKKAIRRRTLLLFRCTGYFAPNSRPLARRGSWRAGDGTDEESRAARTGVKNKRSRR
jgi:hypothetical protein